jgi:catechol 2,3-dioxygenase-like lactoylglutathione lyase family enzyme
MHPKTDGLLESSLYVQDVAASARFYARIFGFRMISDFGERGCAMQAGERQVLLLFKKGGSLGIPSPHDGDGELHIAFAIPASESTRWEAWPGGEPNRYRREAHVGFGRPEHILSGPRPPSAGNCLARRLVDLLKY